MYNKVCLIGVGGIGSNLVEPLARLLSYNRKNGDFSLMLIDGDGVENKNLARQGFSREDVGKPKAAVIADKLKMPGVKIDCYPFYLTPRNMKEIIGDKSIVILAVDNNKTRKIVQQHCLTLDDVLLINGGNETFDGDVTIFQKTKGKEIFPPIWKDQPQIENPTDKLPTEVTHCVERYEEDPQLLCTNLTVAATIMNALTPFLKGEVILWDQSFFDIKHGVAAAELRTGEVNAEK